jgi:hypothetical protein
MILIVILDKRSVTEMGIGRRRQVRQVRRRRLACLAVNLFVANAGTYTSTITLEVIAGP